MKTAEQLTESLKKSLGDKLRSVVLYGSAASHDQSKKYSDINVLVVVQDMDLSTLKSTMPHIHKWSRAGNPPPLFFTEDRIHDAEDVFPLEFLDIKSNHKVLHGEDPFAGLQVPTKNLRHQLEFELRGKLIHLRERYIETEGKKAKVQELLAKSISTFSVLFKGVLRLLGEEPPQARSQVLSALKKHVDIDEPALQFILKLRDRDSEALGQDPEQLLSRMLKSVEAVVDFVDKHQ